MKNFKKHVLTGISFLIPMVVMAGILGAIQKAYCWSGVTISEPTISGLAYSGFNILKISDWMAIFGTINGDGFKFAYGFLCAGIAFSICDRPGIVPGFVIGYYAGGPTKTGFIGAMIMGFAVGYFVNWMKTWKMPKWLKGLMPVMIIPVLSTAVLSIAFFGILQRPIALAMIAFQGWIQGLAEGSLFIVGAVIGACMGFDMGGPVNKTASMAANALYADMPETIGGYAETAKIIGGMTQGIGVGLASFIAPKKFTQQEKDTAISAIPMGLCFITEGVLSFAADDPVRFIPCSMVGAAVASGMAMAMKIATPASHGGILVAGLSNNFGGWVLCLAVGSVITGVAYAFVKKTPDPEDTKEEEIVDLDIDL